MNPDRKEYSDLFVPRLSEPESQELWENIDARLREPRESASRSVRRWSLMSAAAVLLAAAAAVALWAERAAPPAAGTIVEAPARATQELELSDGSKIELEAGAKLRIKQFSEQDAALVLTRGGAWFEVSHRPARSFIVQAGSVEVRVMGTRFRVSLVDEGAPASRVDVEVAQGAVEVRRSGGPSPVVLQAGERWTSASGLGAAAPSPAASAALPPAPVPTSASSGQAAALSAPPAIAELRTASGLFEAANGARVSGRPRDAARLFDQLRKRYRSDPRAALSALQLGRIRLDELGDAAGGIEAFQDALRLGASGSVRDDAQARLVEAYERSGNVEACRRAKQAYLTTLPRGAHRQLVERRCQK